MKITLLTLGRNNDREIERLIGRYTDRLSHYTRFEMRALPDPKGASNMTAEQRKEAESDIILPALTPADRVILLDERGEMPTSRGFADIINRNMVAGTRSIVFVVGGPFGFAQSVYNRADSLLSLSRMTLTHEMVRLFFVEQVYRAFTIIRGESYHHD